MLWRADPGERTPVQGEGRTHSGGVEGPTARTPPPPPPPPPPLLLHPPGHTNRTTFSFRAFGAGNFPQFDGLMSVRGRPPPRCRLSFHSSPVSPPPPSPSDVKEERDHV